MNNTINQKKQTKKQGGTSMKLDIEKIKKKVNRNRQGGYIYGIKFVTTEDAKAVLWNIHKDIVAMGGKEHIARFNINGNIIELMLSNNAIVWVYYFTNKKVFNEVLEKLPEFNIEILNF